MLREIHAHLAGKAPRSRLVSGLRQTYADNDVAQYYDESLLRSYQARFSHFSLVLGVTGTLSIVVRLIARSLGEG